MAVSRGDLRRQKLIERCAALAAVVTALKPIYESSRCTDTQRHFIETMIGAAIWYIPQPDSLWTGKYSVEAVKAIKDGQKVSKDHHYPRKIAARELLGFPSISPEQMLSLYESKYGLFNLVSRTENRKLMRFQRAGTFQNPEDCYRCAGVNLVTNADIEIAIAAVTKSTKRKQEAANAASH